MYLPRELRDVIYKLSIGDLEPGQIALSLHYDPLRNGFVLVREVPPVAPKRTNIREAIRFDYRGLNDSMPLALIILGCISKEIRTEARATYWSDIPFQVDGNVPAHFDPTARALAGPMQGEDTHYFGVMERYLPGLGDEGRFNIKYNGFSLAQILSRTSWDS
jgi:hypothetical protein